MKIGILTFHMALNYGAFWQAYALNKYIEEELGMDSYLIHYESKYTFKQDIIKKVFNANPLKGAYNLFSIFGFKKGWKRMKKTDFTFKIDDTSPNGFDAYILGSDEIWNYNNPFVKRQDYTYFGANFDAQKIITFCPSFGTVNSDQKLPIGVIESIQRIHTNNISVRDKNSQKIIEKVTDKKVPILVDPVFLYELPKDKLVTKQNYILVYGNNFSDSFIQAIKFVAEKEDIKACIEKCNITINKMFKINIVAVIIIPDTAYKVFFFKPLAIICHVL